MKRIQTETVATTAMETQVLIPAMAISTEELLLCPLILLRIYHIHQDIMNYIGKCFINNYDTSIFIFWR